MNHDLIHSSTEQVVAATTHTGMITCDTQYLILLAMTLILAPGDGEIEMESWIFTTCRGRGDGRARSRWTGQDFLISGLGMPCLYQGKMG